MSDDQTRAFYLLVFGIIPPNTEEGKEGAVAEDSCQ